MSETTIKVRNLYFHKCLRCGHEWASPNKHPIACAKCKTPYWDIPPKEKGK